MFRFATCLKMNGVEAFLHLLIFQHIKKFKNTIFVLFVIIIYSSLVTAISHNKCKDVNCINGVCMNGSCICNDGWQGPLCQYCGGKIRLSEPTGFIYDGVGNYSIDIKCSWLIDASHTNSTIRLHIEDFATECGWDYLYIFDGDSVHSPLLAVYSGIMYSKGYAVKRIPEVVTTSGYALIHFYSDVAVNMSGFYISYRLNSCPSCNSSLECSGNGICIEGVCACNESYTGEACDIPTCPNNCSYNGICRKEEHRCECYSKYRGEDCSQLADNGYWEVIQPKEFLPQGSASHTAIIWRDSMYIVGGESYNKAEMIYVYDLNGNVWETPQMDSKQVPLPRYGHSSVLFGDKIYIYGGIKKHSEICNELWAFDVSAKTWENITVRADPCIVHNNITSMCGPLKSVGHTATLFTDKSRKSEVMIAIFGYSPTFGFLNTVQEYHFGTREWKILKTKGFPVKGGYGHSSAWDPLTQRIYVYGGYVSISHTSAQLTSNLYSYEPNTRTWKMLMSAPSARFLHTANFIDGLMLVFGGNTYNGSILNEDAKCYTSDFLIYDAFCDSWYVSSIPRMFYADLARFGHSAVTFGESLYIYGGYDGQMLNGIIRFTAGSCHHTNVQSACLSLKRGIKCFWDRNLNKCVPDTAIARSQVISALESNDSSKPYMICAEETRAEIGAKINQCYSLADCHSCVQTSLQCGWCAQQPTCTSIHNNRCKEHSFNSETSYNAAQLITNVSQCNTEEASICYQQHTCQSCVSLNICHWHNNGCIPASNNTSDDLQDMHQVCVNSCSEFTSCLNCTENQCMWCHNEDKCIDKHGYWPWYPYGQCREWTASSAKCRTPSGKRACSYYKSCLECQADPECGWCDDGSGTGLGVCLSGGNKNHKYCAKENWYFTHCPSCQCNGHSICSNNTNTCQQPCHNYTTGIHCDRCIHGYFGNPQNGGHCQPCECNGQATQCHAETGKCFCTTKGIVGDHCDKCDTQNHYHGDPTAHHGSCFYDLTVDYQFTFNLSKKEDRHFRQINFRNSPTRPDVDAEFNIMCSAPAKMNITVKRGDIDEERPLILTLNCTNYRSKFSKSDYIFGIENNFTLTTFNVYVYDFHPPLWIQISFSQYPKLNLKQFFITFSSCFLLLLLTAAVLWKLKQKYDAYRRRQRLFVEMVQMARRPFAVVTLHMDPKDAQHDVTTISVSNTLCRRKKDYPNPIAMEPCSNNKAAVISFVIRLPTGNSLYTPSGQSGIAIGSALVTLGNQQRKQSMDSTVKIDLKGKGRKCTITTNQNTDNCI